MSGAGSARVRVLLVEDNPADARLLGELLAEVPGRDFALRHFDQLRPALAHRAEADVVLLDLSLPDAQGLETLERFLRDGTDVPVVVLTGLADEELARRAMLAGAQDYLNKSELGPALLARTIFYAIERKRAEHNAKAAEGARRAQLLADVSDVLASSLERDVVAEQLARALVPALARGCLLDLLNGAGMLERVAVAGASPELRSRLERARLSPPGRESPAAQALASRRPLLLHDLDAADVDSVLGEASESGDPGDGPPPRLSSLLAMPLSLRDRPFGVVTLFSDQPGHRFGQDELLLAAEVTRRAALSFENARLYREAQRAIRARDDVVAIVSHDLRNPLSVIGLTMRLMREESGHAPLDMIARCERAQAQMTRLLDDLLDMTRLDQGTMRLEMKRFELGGLMNELVESQRPLAAARGQRLEVIADADVAIDVDRDRLQQVMANLIGNAIKYTPRGGAIDVRAHHAGMRVTVAISDTGPGIDPANLPHVFERFYQAKTTKEGVGLGLAIAKGIVEAHGGSIAATSVPGRGTTFWFELPVANRRATAEVGMGAAAS
jgi:signal transduction histidine kinase/FixJ family two-component response regulator